MKARSIALGGMLTAVAVVIMSLGSMIPVNTYTCPVLCILLTRPVGELCGRRIAGCYYGAVSILSLLLAPDREAAVVYVFLGYYPLIKPAFDRIGSKGPRMAAKLLFFTVAGASAYGVLLLIMGAGGLLAEFEAMGLGLIVVLVILWDVLFVLVDRLLAVPIRRWKK